MTIERVAARYLQKQAGSQDERHFLWGKKQIQDALDTLMDVKVTFKMREEPPYGHGAEGYEALTDWNDSARGMVRAIDAATPILERALHTLRLGSQDKEAVGMHRRDYKTRDQSTKLSLMAHKILMDQYKKNGADEDAASKRAYNEVVRMSQKEQQALVLKHNPKIV